MGSKKNNNNGFFDFDMARLGSVFGDAVDAKALLCKMKESCPQYIPTGFDELDKAMNGGLTASLYVLGARPSLGKSTLLINISEKMAVREDTAVLYFSLEMPADHIARQALCRCLFNAKASGGFGSALDSSVTAAMLLKKEVLEKIKTDEKKVWDAAFARYQKISENFYIIDRNCISEYNRTSASKKGESTVTASFVSNYTAAFIKEEEDREKKRNIVVIMDYLQLLCPEENMKNATERTIVDNSVAVLWNIAHSNKIPVIAISSVNRTTYKDAEAPMELSSFKESGGIEFSADVVWGLQVNREAAPQTQSHRSLQLVILKNRYGSVNRKINLEFYTKFALYTVDAS